MIPDQAGFHTEVEHNISPIYVCIKTAVASSCIKRDIREREKKGLNKVLTSRIILLERILKSIVRSLM